MSSRSLLLWEGTRQRALDEIDSAHTAMGGSWPGRRYATRQINHAYAVLLSSQFQAFCRDLHSEAVDYLCNTVSPPALQTMLRLRLMEGRKLDQGNPSPANLGADFGRFGIQFWDENRRHDLRNQGRQVALESLNSWRNAIAHQHFDPARLGPKPVLRLDDVKRWRQACKALARSFDAVMAQHIRALVGTNPW